jgi:hypothetical protein
MHQSVHLQLPKWMMLQGESPACPLLLKGPSFQGQEVPMDRAATTQKL